MQQPDYTSSNPYYHYPQNPNSAPITTPSPPSYASAPPYTSTYNTPNYPDLLSSSPAPPLHSYNPPPPPVVPPLQQPQLSSPFPSFESHSNYQPYYPSYNSSSVHRASRVHSGSEEGSYPNSSSTTNYPSIYPTTPNYDHQIGPFNNEPVNNYGNFGELGQDIYTIRSEKSGLYGNINNDGSGYGDGVFAYKGSSKVEPYGARGTSSKSSTWSTGFDDFGRPIGYSNSSNSSPKAKIVKASPKVDTIQDVKSGVQKFRVKLLAESGGMSTQDVLCQIGLDGIRMLDPSTSRTLRIYPLDTITRCDVTDSSTFAFWSKSSVDIEPRRIRLQSNSYTTSTLLDTVTAATVQFKEMGGRTRPSESPMVADQPTEKKKGLADWINIVKPVNEEKDHWVPDEAVSKCTACGSGFNAFVRKHHCRNCGDIFCDKCTQGRTALTADENAPVVRVCDRCMAEVTRRLSSAKEAANRSTGLQSHEDLAKKLQEEMERNRRESSGSRSDRSGRMKEVACPTCTVHLQVQVPSSGSETIECGVCQHPFLVSSH